MGRRLTKLKLRISQGAILRLHVVGSIYIYIIWNVETARGENNRFQVGNGVPLFFRVVWRWLAHSVQRTFLLGQMRKGRGLWYFTSIHHFWQSHISPLVLEAPSINCTLTERVLATALHQRPTPHAPIVFCSERWTSRAKKTLPSWKLGNGLTTQGSKHPSMSLISARCVCVFLGTLSKQHR